MKLLDLDRYENNYLKIFNWEFVDCGIIYTPDCKYCNTFQLYLN